MIAGYVSGEGEVAIHFAEYSASLSREVDAATKRLTVKLQTKVKTEKLTGQVLGVRTGRGRRSIQQTTFREGDKSIGVVSTNVFYMIGWETGWANWKGGTALATAKAKFNPAAGPRKRAFLVPSLGEMDSGGTIRAEYDAAARRAVRA